METRTATKTKDLSSYLSSYCTHRIRYHDIGFLLALLAGVVYSIPNILFIMKTGKEYGHPFLGMPDESHYASRIREVYDGHYAIANPDSYRFLASFPGAGLVCDNQQIITSIRMHPYDWSLYCQARFLDA